MASIFTPLLLFFLSLISLTTGQNSTNITSTPNAAVFVYDTTAVFQYTYALSVDSNNEDLYIYINTPSTDAWVGFGLGSEMSNSLMFIFYASANGSAVTISPRIGGPHVEPTYTDKVACTVLNSTFVDNNANIMYGGWKCTNALSTAKIPIGAHASPTQPFIFAFGPASFTMNSDDMSAPMRRHQFYGHFTMDMTKASQPHATFPLPNGPNSGWISQNASPATGTSSDSNRAPIAHAVLMCATFILVFPFGSLVLRLKNLVIPHLIVQTGGFVFIIIAFGLGIHISKQYNRSNHFQSAHQIIGLTLIALLCAQIGLGFFGHRQNKQAKKRTPLSLAHFILGPTIILLGVVNGGLGINLAGNAWGIFQYYICIVVAVALLYGAARTTCFCLARRRKRREQPVAPEEGGYQYPEFGSPVHADYNAGQYNAGQYSASQGVPMQPFFPGPPGHKDNVIVHTTMVR